MKNLPLPTLSFHKEGAKSVSPSAATEAFRRRFQRSVRECVRKGFSMEESFGMIWMETMEEILLTEDEEAELYQEMICWAKGWLRERDARGGIQAFSGAEHLISELDGNGFWKGERP